MFSELSDVDSLGIETCNSLEYHFLILFLLLL